MNMSCSHTDSYQTQESMRWKRSHSQYCPKIQTRSNTVLNFTLQKTSHITNTHKKTFIKKIMHDSHSGFVSRADTVQLTTLNIYWHE